MLLLYLGLLFGVCSGQKISLDHAIERPCLTLDPNCIRSFFAQHSHCRPVYGHQQDTHHMEYLSLPLLHANLTFIWDDAKVTGLDNWRITKFTINRVTKKILMEVKLTNVTTYSDKAHLRYYLKGREPVELTDFFSYTYEQRFITATVPYDSVSGILWHKLDAFAHLPADTARYSAGPDLVNLDLEVRASYDEMFGNIKMGLMESSFVTGNYYFNLFFENYICKP